MLPSWYRQTHPVPPPEQQPPHLYTLSIFGKDILCGATQGTTCTALKFCAPNLHLALVTKDARAPVRGNMHTHHRLMHDVLVQPVQDSIAPTEWSQRALAVLHVSCSIHVHPGGAGHWSPAAQWGAGGVWGRHTVCSEWCMCAVACRMHTHEKAYVDDVVKGKRRSIDNRRCRASRYQRGNIFMRMCVKGAGISVAHGACIWTR